MILVVTNSGDVTSDYMCAILAKKEIDFLRLNSDEIVRNVGIEFDGDVATLIVRGRRLCSTEVDAVWYRRPKSIIDSVSSDCAKRELPDLVHFCGEWSEAIEGYLAQIEIGKWINHPSRNAMASRKLEQISRARRLGFQVPPTLVCSDSSRARSFFYRHEGSVVVKPIWSGYIEKEEEPDALIYTSRLSSIHLGDFELINDCPTFLQKAIFPKTDIRVTVIDDNVVAVELIRIDQAIDVRRNNMDGVKYRRIDVPQSLLEKVILFTNSYGLRFSAMDFVTDQDGTWYFLENNPNGQWAWLDLYGDANIAEVFTKCLRK